MKNFKSLTVAFALAAAALTGACAQVATAQNNQPAPLPMAVSTDSAGQGRTSAFDANKIAYDVDTRTGKCFAVTFYGAGASYGMMGMSNVTCDSKVLSLVPSGKLPAYNANFGTPAR